MFCVNCGAKLEDGTKFCPNCGAALSQAVPARAVPMQAVPTQQMSVQKRSGRSAGRIIGTVICSVVIVAVIIGAIWLLSNRATPKSVVGVYKLDSVTSEYQSKQGGKGIKSEITKNDVYAKMLDSMYECDFFNTKIEIKENGRVCVKEGVEVLCEGCWELDGDRLELHMDGDNERYRSVFSITFCVEKNKLWHSFTRDVHVVGDKMIFKYYYKKTNK